MSDPRLHRESLDDLQMSSTMTQVALEGYEASANAASPYGRRTRSQKAWLLGQWLRATGRPSPSDVRHVRSSIFGVRECQYDVSDITRIQRIC